MKAGIDYSEETQRHCVNVQEWSDDSAELELELMRDRKGNSKVFCEYINIEKKAKKNKLIDGERDCGGLTLASCQLLLPRWFITTLPSRQGKKIQGKTCGSR